MDHTYDTHARQKAVTDARNGTTTYAYNDADQVTSVTTPAPGTGQPAQTTSYNYDANGRLTRTQLPDGGGVTNLYSLKGERLTNYGARTYPVAYAYDSQGRRTNLTTWKNFAAKTGAANTRWIYNDRGLMTAKVYDDGRGTTNTYTAAGRLRTRTWARGIVTTYHTNAAGQTFATTYSDSTSAVTNAFDRLGRPTNILDGAGSRYLTYNDSGLLLMETNASGTLAGLALTYGYDQFLRRTNLQLRITNYVLLGHSYAFDQNSSRLTNVSDGTYNAGYSYLANSPLVSQVLFRSNSTTRMTTTKTYDHLNRLLAIANQPSAAGESPISFSYLSNDANQRTRRTDPDGSYWLYEYDKLGQLTSGKHYWPDNTPVAGQQFEYAYDDIGNRSSTKQGGDQSGAGLRWGNRGRSLGAWPASFACNIPRHLPRREPGKLNKLGTDPMKALPRRA